MEDSIKDITLHSAKSKIPRDPSVELEEKAAKGLNVTHGIRKAVLVLLQGQANDSSQAGIREQFARAITQLARYKNIDSWDVPLVIFRFRFRLEACQSRRVMPVTWSFTNSF